MKSSANSPDLSTEERALFLRLLAEEEITPVQVIPRRANIDEAPLSFAQQRLWFLDQLIPNSSLYNCPVAAHLQGRLDLNALERSLNEIIRRHDVLRTTFPAIAEQPVQAIAPTSHLRLPVIDLQNLPQAAREAECRRLAAAEAGRPFDLSKDSMLRARLLRVGDKDHVLLLTMHHISSDAWSMGVLVKEMAALYEAYSAGRPSPLHELPLQYVDYAVWQRESMRDELLQAQLAYWKQHLTDAPPVLDLPLDHPRPLVQSHRGAMQSLTLPSSLSTSLTELSQQHGVTLFMTLLAAFQVLLARYTRQDDISVATPVAGRNRAELEGLIGFFVNTLVLRTDLSGNPPFSELLRRVREAALGAYAHQDLPFERLVEQLQPERDLGSTPLFQVMMVLQNAPTERLKLHGLNLSLLPNEWVTAKFDLTLLLNETSDGLILSAEYSTDIFQAETIGRLLMHYEKLLESVVVDPQRRISDLDFITTAERQQLLVGWNDTQAEYDSSLCIHELFERQAERTPNAIAVAFKDDRLSYRELNERANKLAHHLRRLGTGPETLVGACLERSAEAVVTILGVLKAGAGYLPLAPEQPLERLSFMLADARIRVLLTQEHLLASVPRQETHVVCLDKEWPAIVEERAENPRSSVLAENPAYLIYTSGSTGSPKGVLVSHRNLIHSTLARFSYYDESINAFLLLSPFAFDSSVAGLFWTLCQGGTLVIPEEGSYHDPAHLADLIVRHSVSHVLGLPALCDLILQQAGVRQSASLRTVIVAGEACPAGLIARHVESLPEASFFNEYGPTEATVWSSVHPCDALARQRTVPIGRPVTNTQIYLLDPQLQPVPIGITHEVYIGGEGLARGYLNHPALTAERFIPNPFSVTPGARLYKTGDLARFLADGSIEYAGRTDFQVKIRGHRIETSEIELALTQHPHVKEAVVLARETVTGDKRLAAYVVLHQAGKATAKQLKESLKEKLPQYMLPSSFVVLDALPLTATGKVDRNALPVDEIGVDTDEGYVAPRTAVEEVLAGIFSETLARERTGANDSFFDLGGHSLLAVQVSSRIREALQVEVPLRQLFKTPTVAGLAMAILEDEADRERVERTAELLLELANFSDDEVEDLLAQKRRSLAERHAHE